MKALLTLWVLASLPGADGDRLQGLLRQHFLAESDAEQKRRQKEILSTDGLTGKKLARAIRKLQLWKPQPTGRREITLQLREVENARHQAQPVLVEVPDGYDPTHAHPLLMVLHGAGGGAEWVLDYALRLLGTRASKFIVAAPKDYRGLGFTFSSDEVGKPRYLLNALRRRFHIDSDRVYLLGYSMGGHNAWLAGVMHADCFAGIIPLATPLQLIGGDMLYEELLPNCRRTGILFCWGAQDHLDQEGNPHPNGGNAAMNRKMAEVIKDLDFKRFEAVELPDAGHTDVVPTREAFARLIDRKRRHYPKRLRQAFRLPQQSTAYWVAAEGLRGEPLPHGNLQLSFPPVEDPLKAQRRYLLGRLGRIEATCKGQQIKIKSRRVARVVLLLSDQLLDLDEPVTILRGRKEVFRGRIRRDLRVMLTEAARGWDFDRLPTARIVIPVAGRVKMGYP